MKPLKATATTSQPVLTIQQIETIFYKIQDIYEIHKEFYDNLCPKVQQWDSQVTMGHLFQKLVSVALIEGPYPGPQWSCWWGEDQSALALWFSLELSKAWRKAWAWCLDSQPPRAALSVLGMLETGPVQRCLWQGTASLPRWGSGSLALHGRGICLADRQGWLT